MSTKGPARIPPVDPAALTPEQQDVFDRIAGSRGRVAGPFTVLLHVPALADRVQHLGAYLRYEARLDRDVAETAVLVTAQRRSSPFEWEAHEPLARRAGVPEDVLDALKAGASTDSMPPRFRAIVDYSRELADTGGAAEGAYAAAIAIVGAEGMVELTVLVGYYALLAMTLAAHDLDARWT